MDKDFNYYIRRMGYIASYLLPEHIDTDEEFEYYMVKVPRHYIRMIADEGEEWPDYVETEEEGKLDRSVVLGMYFLPVYQGVDFYDEDADFLYYIVRVPHVFLNHIIEGTSYTYRIVFELDKIKSVEQVIEEELDSIPVAGTAMPGTEEFTALRKAKSRPEGTLYELSFLCQNPECHKIYDGIVTSDLFDELYARVCEECYGTRFEILSARPLEEVREDG